MKIHLSYSDFIANFDTFLRNFDASNPESLSISTDDRWVSAHPAVLALTAALGLQAEKVTIDRVVARSGHYLERMGLFSALGLPSQFHISERDASGRFVPLIVIKNQEEQSRFITEIVPMLHLQPKDADPIQYVLGELVRNVLEHSGPNAGAIVAAQYYASKHMIRLGICDTGYGIRRTIGPVWPQHAHSDLEAIKWALVPGVSGTTTRESGTDLNAGAGLFIVKSMSFLARNYFLVYSGSGVYKLLKRRPDVKSAKLHADPSDDRHSERDDAPYLQGTLVAMDMTLDQTKELASLLAAIRQVYSDAIKARRKARYKRPQFI
jgi:anti-sigma regulatory factor (Ser/Thr protein kinase)